MTVDLERILLGGPDDSPARRDTPLTALPKIARNFEEVETALNDPDHPGIIPGLYYCAETVVGATTAAAVAANTLYAQPFRLEGEFDRIGIEVTTFASGAARMGIYTNHAGPADLILDAGTLDTGGSNAIKPITIPLMRAPRGLFWLVSVFDALPQCRLGGAQRTSLVGTIAPTNTVRGLSAPFTYGGLPATAPPMTGTPSNVPMMLVWKSV